MPRIANPIISPLGQAFDSIAKVLIGMPTVEERQMRASQAELMKAQREKALIDAQMGQRQLSAVDGIGQVFERMNGPIPTVEMQGPMPSGAPLPAQSPSRDEWVRSNMGQLFSQGAALNPNGLNQLGALARAFIANTGGASPRMVTQSMLGAGDSMQSTPVGFEQAQAQDWRKAQLQSSTSYGVAKMAADRAAATQEAIAARALQAQQAQEDRMLIDIDTPQGRRTVTVADWKAMGAPPTAPADGGYSAGIPAAPDPLARPARSLPNQAQGAPFTYLTPTGQRGMTSDGRTDIQTGQALPPGSTRIAQNANDSLDGLTKTQNFDLAQQNVQLGGFENTISTLRQLGADPTNVGTAGNVRNLLQNSLESLDAVAAIFGMNPGAVRSIVAGSGASTDFRSQIPQLDMMANLAAYQGAQALAGQSGKGLSNEDVKRFRDIIGDPMSWAGNQATFYAKLDQLQRQVAAEVQQAQRLRASATGRPMAAPTGPGGTPAPAMTGPGGTPAPGARPDPLGIR